MKELEETFVMAMKSNKRIEAFAELKRAWSSEMGAMSQCEIPTALDVMLLAAAVDNKREMLELQRKLQQITEKVAVTLPETPDEEPSPPRYAQSSLENRKEWSLI